MAERTGAQSPRVIHAPSVKDSRGQEAVEIAKQCGLVMDPWQQLVLERSLGMKGGKWAAFEVGVNVARQNGKGGILEARELAGLFVFGERLLIHSAHEFATSMEAFLRMEQLLEEGGLISELKPRSGISRSHGDEGFRLKSGQRIRYRTRTKGGGRGFSCDCLILDEAMFISEFAHGALLPTLSARPNPQVWYTGSAVDQYIHDNGVVFARVRERGLAGTDPGLAYFEWSADFDDPSEVEETHAQDEGLWALANPGLGIRITPEHVAHEQRSMDNRTFAVERLGVGDWPDTSGLQSIIELSLWDSLADANSAIKGDLVFAFDISPQRTSASVAVSGTRPDELGHVEIVKRDSGTGWVVPWVAERAAKHRAAKIICDSAGPAAALIPDLEQRGIKVEALTAQDYARACGVFFDTVEQRGFRHLGTSELRSAIKAAATRPLGDAWAWSRKNSGADITPLVSSTLAWWGVTALKAEKAWVGGW